jgi:hypothetical protein
MEREAHVLVESRDSTGISLKEESAIGLSRSETQEDVSSIAENTFNSEASESFKRTGVE